MSGDIVSAAEALQDQADAATEAAEEAAEAALENAQDRVEAAEDLAQRLTDAALQTELGRRVDALQGELSSCRTEITNLSETVTAQALEIQALKAPPVVVVPEAEPSSSPIQPTSEILTPDLTLPPSPTDLLPSEGGAGREGAGDLGQIPRTGKRRLI